MRLRLGNLLFLLAACGDNHGAESRPDASNPDAPEVDPDAPSGCVRDPAPEDRTRYVVVSHPYNAAGGRSSVFEVIEMSASGTLTRATPPRTFSAARASAGAIAFTPDGKIGMVPTENGNLSVFSLDDAGTPTVIHAELDTSFYASKIVMQPGGKKAYVLDTNWRNNGGGIYEIEIACDGTVTELGKVVEAKLPAALAFIGNDRAVVAAADVADSMTDGDDVHLLDWSTPTRAKVSATEAFGPGDPVLTSGALTHDGQVFLVTDTSGFSGVPNRVAVVGVSATSVRKINVVEIEDPATVVTSPFGNVALVTSGFGDALWVIDDQGTNGNWRVRGEVAYQGGGPALPVDMVTIDRGTLRGHVLVGEVDTLRHLAFRPNGAVEDLGQVAFDEGLDEIVGAVGVQP